MASADPVITKGRGLGAGTEPELLPLDYLSTAKLPEGRSSDHVVFEKANNLRKMIELGRGLSGIGPELVEACAHIAMRAHPNQFRDEPGSPHFSTHLVEVAQRSLEIAAAFKNFFPNILNAHGDVPAESILISLSLLHRAQNDFAKNQWAAGKEIDPELAQITIRKVIKAQIEALIGPDSAEFMIDCLDALRNDNPEGFPDRKYIEGLAKSPFTSCVRLAELSRDLDTEALLLPEYHLVASPLTITTLAHNPDLSTMFLNKMLHCLDNFDSARIEPHPPGINERGFNQAVGMLARSCGSSGLEQVRRFFQEIHIQALEDSILPVDEDDTTKLRLRAIKAELLCLYFDRALKRGGGAIPQNPFSLDGIKCISIGPITGFQADLPATPSQLQDALKKLEPGYVTGFSGYYLEKGGQMVFRMNRVPPPNGPSHDTPEALDRAARDISEVLGISTPERNHPRTAYPVIRAIFSLEDSHYEQRKVAILNSIDAGELDFANAIEVARASLGSAGLKAVGTTSVRNLAELREVLERLDLVVHHNPDTIVNELEMRYHLAQPVTIVTAYHDKEAPHMAVDQKPGLLLVGALNDEFYNHLIRLADKFHLSGFVSELPSLDLAYRLEISAFSDEKSA